jgi:hypothetical protein
VADDRIAAGRSISRLKAEHRMSCNYLKGRGGDRADPVLAVAGYNFALLLCWLRRVSRALLQALFPPPTCLQYH